MGGLRLPVFTSLCAWVCVCGGGGGGIVKCVCIMYRISNVAQWVDTPIPQHRKKHHFMYHFISLLFFSIFMCFCLFFVYLFFFKSTCQRSACQKIEPLWLRHWRTTNHKTNGEHKDDTQTGQRNKQLYITFFLNISLTLSIKVTFNCLCTNHWYGWFVYKTHVGQ